MTRAEVEMVSRLDSKLGSVGEVLAGLVKWAESIDKRLAALNGSVAKHEERFVEVTERFVEVSERQGRAEVMAREAALNLIAADRERASAEIARQKEAAKYQRWLFPILKYAITGALILILEHGQEIVKAIEGVKP